MVDDGIMVEYDYDELDKETFKLKYICRVIDGNHINSVKVLFMRHMSKYNID